MNIWRMLMVLAVFWGLVAAAGMPPSVRAEQIQAVNFTGMVSDGSGHGYPLAAQVIANNGTQDFITYTNPLDGTFITPLEEGLYTVTIIPFLEGYMPYVQSGVDVSQPLNVALQVSPSCEAPGYGPFTEITLYDYDFTLFNQDFFVDPGSQSASWEYGLPLDGPIPALNVWGTALNGNYNPLEDSHLVSPAMDTSALSSGFWLEWQHWFEIAYPEDVITIEAKNALGSWLPVWTVSSALSDGWRTETTYLDGQYAHTDFQFRFRLTENGDGTQATGWYLMRARIYSASCYVYQGGLVYGQVTNDGGEGINGARVLSIGSPPLDVISQSWAQPGFYMGFQRTPPNQTSLTANKLLYGSNTTGLIDIIDNGVTEVNDIILSSGRLVFDPGDLADLKFPFLGGGEAILNLSNTGTLPINFEIVELPIFTGIGTAAPPRMEGTPEAETFFAFDQNSHTLVSFLSTTPGVIDPIALHPGLNIVGADFLPGEPQRLYAIDGYSNTLMRLGTVLGWVDPISSLPPPTGQNWVGLTAGADGWLYGLANDALSQSTVVKIDPRTGAIAGETVLLAPAVVYAIALDDTGNLYGVMPGMDRLSQFNLVTGQELDFKLLPFNSERNTVSLEFNSSDGLLYLSAQPIIDDPALYAVNFDAANFVMMGEQPGTWLAGLAQAQSGRADIPWISADQVSGIIPTGGNLEITFIFTPGGLAPGTYEAFINIVTDAPDEVGGNQVLGRGRIPVTMRVIQPTLLIETPETAHKGEMIDVVMVFDADGDLLGGAIEAQAAIENLLPTGLAYVPGSLLADYGAASYNPGTHAIIWTTPTDLSNAPEVVIITYRAVITDPPGSTLISQADLTYGDSGEYSTSAVDSLTVGHAVFMPVALK